MDERRKKEGRIFLFNDALSTFYLRLYGVRHMVMTTPIVKEETRCCHHMSYCSIRSNGSFIYDHPTDRIAHTNRGALAGTKKIS